MSLPHLSALKIGYWIAGSIALTAGALFAQIQQANSSAAIWVAIIMGLSSLLVSVTVGIFSIILQTRGNRKLAEVEKQTNNMNTELRQQRNAATTRADVAEGHAAGITAEQDRTKGT